MFHVIDKGNKQEWITTELCIEWFKNYFVLKVRSHGRAIGQTPDCKILLLLDNCSAQQKVLFIEIGVRKKSMGTAKFRMHADSLCTDIYNDLKWSPDLCAIFSEICGALKIKGKRTFYKMYC